MLPSTVVLRQSTMRAPPSHRLFLPPAVKKKQVGLNRMLSDDFIVFEFCWGIGLLLASPVSSNTQACASTLWSFFQPPHVTVTVSVISAIAR